MLQTKAMGMDPDEVKAAAVKVQALRRGKQARAEDAARRREHAGSGSRSPSLRPSHFEPLKHSPSKEDSAQPFGTFDVEGQRPKEIDVSALDYARVAVACVLALLLPTIIVALVKRF